MKTFKIKRKIIQSTFYKYFQVSPHVFFVSKYKYPSFKDFNSNLLDAQVHYSLPRNSINVYLRRETFTFRTWFHWWINKYTLNSLPQKAI